MRCAVLISMNLAFCTQSLGLVLIARWLIQSISSSLIKNHLRLKSRSYRRKMESIAHCARRLLEIYFVCFLQLVWQDKLSSIQWYWDTSCVFKQNDYKNKYRWGWHFFYLVHVFNDITTTFFFCWVIKIEMTIIIWNIV